MSAPRGAIATLLASIMPGSNASGRSGYDRKRILAAAMLFLGVIALIALALPASSSSSSVDSASTTKQPLPQALFDTPAIEVGAAKISAAEVRAATQALIDESEERDAAEQMPRAPSPTSESDGQQPKFPPFSELDAGYHIVRRSAQQRQPSFAVDVQKTNIDGSVPPPATLEPPRPAVAPASAPAPRPVPESAPRPPPAHWTYSSPRTGPFNWGNLDPAYAACSSGHRQSPVDFKIVDPIRHPAAAALPSAVHTDPNLSHILFNYLPSNVTLIHHANVTHIDSTINNGHTIQVNYERGSEIFVNEQRFDLIQFHFHSPSEHTLNGRHFDMEMHLVHQRPSDPASLAVVALWLEIPHGTISAIHDLRGQYSSLDDLSDANTSGELRRLLHLGSNPFLDRLNWAHLPADPSEVPLPPQDTLLNIFDILPFDQGYITYQGSLTTPPCSEIVEWLVLKSPISCSLAQRNAFQKIFGQNSRPTQLLHGRNVSATVDQERVEIISSGVSHDLFMVVMGALIVVSLLLLFGVIFLCTRTQHRMGRNIGFAAHGGAYAPIGNSHYNQHVEPSPGYLGSTAAGGGGGKLSTSNHVYHAIDPLDDEMENGNRYRAAAQASAQAQSGATALAMQQQQQQPLLPQASSAELAAPRPVRPAAIAPGSNVPAQGYGSIA